MKKMVLIWLVGAISLVSNAQDRFSFWLGSGYNFDISPDFTGITNVTVFDSLTTVKSSEVYLGNGMTVGAGLEYKLKNGFSTGLVVEYFMGEKNYIEQTYQDSASQSFKDSTYQYVFYASFTEVKPYVAFRHTVSNMHYAAGAGIVLGLGHVIRELTRLYPYKTYYEKYWYKGGVAAGMFVRFSVEYFIKPRLAFSGVVGASTLTYMPSKGELVEAYEDGSKTVDVLDDKPLSERETEFVDSYDYIDGQIDKDKPSKELRPYFNLNAFYFRLGLRFLLEAETESAEKPTRKL